MKFVIIKQSRETVTVNGTLVTIPGYEEYEFVVYRSLGINDNQFSQHYLRPEQKWSVAEKSTSAWLAYGRTKKEAIANAGLKLSKYTKEQIKAALQRVRDILDSSKPINVVEA